MKQKQHTKTYYTTVQRTTLFLGKQYGEIKQIIQTSLKSGKTHTILMVNLTRQIYFTNCYNMQLKQIITPTNAAEIKQTLLPTVITVTKQKTIYIYLSPATEIWKDVKPTYQKLTKKHHTSDQHILTLTSNNNNYKCKKLVLTLTQLIINEIWQSRNSFKYHKVLLAQETRNKINNSRPSSTHTIITRN